MFGLATQPELLVVFCTHILEIGEWETLCSETVSKEKINCRIASSVLNLNFTIMTFVSTNLLQFSSPASAAIAETLLKMSVNGAERDTYPELYKSCTKIMITFMKTFRICGITMIVH